MTPAHRAAQFLKPAVGGGSGMSLLRHKSGRVLAKGKHENPGPKLTTSAKARSADFAMSECESERVSEW